MSNPIGGASDPGVSRLATRTPISARPEPIGVRSRKMSGWIVPKTDKLEPPRPESAGIGPACVPADLRAIPKTTAAIPSGIAGTPNRTNMSPTHFCAA
jgi:hypothetical protein